VRGALRQLNITFGRALILPWMGLEAFSAWFEWSKYAHNYLSFAFTLGVVLMFLMWVGENFPTDADAEWLKKGGGKRLVGRKLTKAMRSQLSKSQTQLRIAPSTQAALRKLPPKRLATDID
jgi:formate dehydrogenase subunit gamma